MFRGKRRSFKRMSRRPYRSRGFKSKSRFSRRKGSKRHVKASGAYGETYNKIVLMNRPQSFRGKLGSKNQYFTNSGLNLSVGNGLQARSALQFFDKSLLRLLANNMGLAGNTTTDGVVANTNQWFLNRGYINFEFANMSNSQCYLDLYIYKCIRDTSQSPVDLWLGSVFDATGSTATDVTLYVGQSPVTAPKIARFWSLKKVIHHSMKPGETHRQVFDFKTNRVVNNELLYGVAGEQADTNIAGITFSMLMVYRGGPVYDVTNNSGTSAISRLCGTGFQTYYSTYITDTSYNLAYQNNITTGATVHTYDMGDGDTTQVAAQVT